jgi:GNAT superfamily N-acetyltransferase
LNLRIEQATEEDVNLIREFIQALAEYEKLSHHFEATEDRLRNALFGPDPKAFVLLAYDTDVPVGFAVYFYTFSTFTGLPGLYLEDLFVKPSTRGRGVGRALLRHLARIALQQNCWRIEWAVLHWNESAIRFYQKLGAVPMSEWSVYRLHGEHLTALANS